MKFQGSHKRPRITRVFACLVIAITFGNTAAFVASLQAATPASREPQQPNIVLIMVDDMGWSDIGCYGSEIHTPNIDRLASEGMLFTQFYNNAKCTTTRASLLTGLYPRNGGRGQHELITKNMLTLGEAMRHAGYATGMSGKWHNGSKAGTRPCDRGFVESYGLGDGCCNFLIPRFQIPLSKEAASAPSATTTKPSNSKTSLTTTTPPTPSLTTRLRQSRVMPPQGSRFFTTSPTPLHTIPSMPSQPTSLSTRAAMPQAGKCFVRSDSPDSVNSG